VSNSSLKQSLKNTRPTIQPQDYPTDGGPYGEDLLLAAARLPVSAKSPQPPKADEESYRRSMVWRDKARLGVEITALFVGLAGIYGLLVTFWETQKSTQAATRAAVAAEQAATATVDQVKVAQDTLKLTTENNRLDQRPWIFIVETPLKIGEISKSSEFTGLPMKVANNGRTPAYIFETSHVCKTGPLPVIPRYEPRPENIIVPLGPTFTATPKFEGGLPENLVIDARMGKRSLYCYGYYKYRDWWGEEHATGYVFKFDRLTLGFSFDSTPQYVYAR